MPESNERKLTLATRIFQLSMIALLVTGWLLIRFAHLDNNVALIVFFSVFAAGYLVVRVIQSRLKKKAGAGENDRKNDDERDDDSIE